ncbi:MAG: hypothetical protein WC847_02045 [Candidatus Paceibacterota bacterium]|jgi:hypothetical protein
MNLEGTRSIDKKEEDPQKQAENIFGKSLVCFKKIGKVGLAAGALFVAGEAVKSVNKDIEYNRHITSSFNPEQLKQKETNETEIKKIFGYGAVSQINEGDQNAYFQNKEEKKDPELKGFEGKNFSVEPKYLFTEKYGAYPKGWISGQIKQIKFISSIKETSRGHSKLGGFQGGNVYLYTNPELSGGTIPVDNTTIAHEFAHANDWDSDINLNILERQTQLLEVHKRLMAPDAFGKDDINSDYLPHLNGTRDGLLRAAHEYWAEICAEYFTNPESFLKDHPNDFKLVDSFVKKKDPAFDIFSKNRGAFDPHTGQVRDIYKDK